VTEAFRKVTKIHSRLPQGGILVFMTGQGEITALCRKLERKFGQKAIKERQQARDKKQTSTDAASMAARDWEAGKSGTQSSTVSPIALVDCESCSCDMVARP
jgi:HrpA-like RNA helicase